MTITVVIITYVYNSETALTKRLKMDKRRLEDAHFCFAMLNIVQWYSDDLDITEIIFSSDMSKTLLQFTPIFQKLFYSKYSGNSYICVIKPARYVPCMYVCSGCFGILYR